MGKWTLEHHDEVLRDKMKALVQGAVKRMRLESNVDRCSDPIISYEAFVEELDTGDSFATSIIDILVKEYADRRMRSNPEDRRLISDRTVKSLRHQAAPPRIYRDRHTATSRLTGRRYHTTDFPSAQDEQLSDEDDEFGTIVNGGMEGARLHSELFDAYNAANEFLGLPQSDATPLATGSPEPADPARDAYRVTSPRPVSPSSLGPFRSSTWAPPAGASSSMLSRSTSVRRPIRTRTVDFNDFTHRRRTNFRSLQTSDSDRPERPEASTSSGWRFRSRDETPALHEEPVAPPSSTTQPRRFFPLNSWQTRRREVAGSLNWNHEATGAPLAGGAAEQPPSTSPSSSQLWYSLTASADAPALPPPMERENSTHLSLHQRLSLPPLRRGGLRPPESLLSRHASPAHEGGGTTPDAGASQLAGGAPTVERTRFASPVIFPDWSDELRPPQSLSPIPAPLREW